MKIMNTFLKYLFGIQYKIQGLVSPLSGSPEVLISFSVTLSHSVANYLTSCRGVNPTSQGVCISSRSCTRYSLVTGRPAAAGNRTPVCCVGGVNDNHYTTRPTLHHPADITPPGRLEYERYLLFTSSCSLGSL